MSDLLKDMYNYESISNLASDIKAVYEPFQVEEFVKSTMDETWNSLELKARGRQIVKNLGKYLPSDYKTALSILDKIIVNWDGFIAILFSDFVEVYGQDEKYWDLSIKALENYTKYCSSEFAVRPFIISCEERMMQQMYDWSKHENEHVRRLSSEGCRPQLPWAQSLPSFKKDPSPILPILENLKTDPSLYVRKSVANNLNDISKTHPDLVAKIAKEWYGKNKHTDWIIKHGCRTLLKKGNRDVLAIFGYENADCVDAQDFALDKTSLAIGEEFTFSFTILTKEATKVRLEYAIDFVKSNGKRNRKIFQISEVSFKENQKKLYTKNHSFADLSTRKHYVGIHSIALIINGVEQETLDFEVKAKQSTV